jgi:hypothetical protein
MHSSYSSSQTMHLSNDIDRACKNRRAAAQQTATRHYLPTLGDAFKLNLNLAHSRYIA